MLVEDLWPDSVGVKVLTPRAILLAQAAGLAKRTQGWVKARLVEGAGRPDRVLRTDAFELYSEAASYSEPLLEIEYNPQRVYPVNVYSGVSIKRPRTVYRESRDDTGCECSNQEEFVDVLREILSAPETRSLIDSMMASAFETTSAEA